MFLFPKEIEVLQADLEPIDRAVQAVILSQYRRKIAEKYKLGNTTIGEAQLIGRGARYFPFQLDETQDKYGWESYLSS